MSSRSPTFRCCTYKNGMRQSCCALWRPYRQQSFCHKCPSRRSRRTSSRAWPAYSSGCIASRCPNIWNSSSEFVNSPFKAINFSVYSYLSKHLYNTIESVCGVWDVELQTVLEINKLGHRRRILQSLAYIRQMRESKSLKTPLAENNETNKMTTNGNKEATPSSATTTTSTATSATVAGTAQPNSNASLPHRNSITGYRKNR